MKNYKERDSYPMSYKQSKNYAEPGMFTDEQLKRIAFEAERCERCPYPDDCHVCPWDIIKDELERVQELKRYHAEGMPDRAIAGRMRMTSKTVKALREVLGLKDNGPYQVWYEMKKRERARNLSNVDNKVPSQPKKYTVYDKNGQYIIEGTAKQCAARLGIREDSFYFNVGLSRRGELKKYEIYEVKE